MANDKFEGNMKKNEGSTAGGFSSISGTNAEPKSKGQKAIGSAQEAFADAKDYMEESYEAVSTRINDKPVQSALIALGVGYMLSKLLRL